MEYTILYSFNAIDLCNQCQGHIAEGWVPLGGVSMTIEHGSKYFAQAMTRLPPAPEPMYRDF